MKLVGIDLLLTLEYTNGNTFDPPEHISDDI